MGNKKAADERQHVQPQEQGVASNNTTAILTDSEPEVKNELARLRVVRGISTKDMVEVVQTLYPRYDRYLHSKCENGDKYGIQLRDDAEKLLLRHYAEEPQKRAMSDRRKKPKRIQARVSEAVYGQLQRRIARTGETMQDFLEGLILDFIILKKGAPVMQDIPDHPIIQNLERTGYPDGKEPEAPHCPACGKECETIYMSDGDVIGCDECIKTKDARETDECFPNQEGGCD